VSVRVTLTMTAAGAFSFGPWYVENMPTSRCVTTAVTLPNGRIFVMNGAKQGIAGFGSLTRE